MVEEKRISPFIHDSYRLLEKLEKKGLWNKDTLVIGLDKSVRPLAYTLRKLASSEGKENPDIKFIDYSTWDEMRKGTNEYLPRVMNEIKRIIKPVKEHKNTLILDYYTHTGGSFSAIKDMLDRQGAIEGLVADRASLYVSKRLKDSNIIFSHAVGRDKGFGREYAGVDDKKKYVTSEGGVTSLAKKDKEAYKKFVDNRYALSKDIKNYLEKRKRGLIDYGYEFYLGEEEKSEGKLKKSLEKILSSVFAFAFFFGLISSTSVITGNAIGIFETKLNLISPGLIAIGLIGFLFVRKYKK